MTCIGTTQVLRGRQDEGSVRGQPAFTWSGGIRSGADAKAVALGAKPVPIGVASFLALGCNPPT